MDMVLSHWSANWPVLACYAVVAAAHLTGLLRILTGGVPASAKVSGSSTAGSSTADSGTARRELQREALLFHLGLLTVLLALVSPVAYWSAVYIWVRAVQELMLAFVGPGLIVVGAPWPALRQCLRPAETADAGPGLAGDSSDRPARVPWLLARPVLAAVAFNVIWIGWHLPVLFDLAHTNTAAVFVEHATYLGAGVVFWLQLIGSRPWSPPTPPLRRAALLIGTVLAGTVLGMVLVFGSGVLYPVYGGAAHHVMTVVDDQELAGAVLWMGMLPPLIVATVALLLRWLSDEETAELSADLDRLLSRRKSSWPSRPGLR